MMFDNTSNANAQMNFLSGRQASVLIAANVSLLDFVDAMAIGSWNVRIVCEQCVLGVYRDVDNTTGISLQNLLVKPVPNRKTTHNLRGLPAQHLQ